MNNSSKKALTKQLLSLYDEFMSLSPNKKKKADGPINSNLPEFQAVAPNLSALLPDSPDGKFINGEAVIKAYNNYKSVVATISISQDLKTMQATADSITAAAKELQAACTSAYILYYNKDVGTNLNNNVTSLAEALRKSQLSIQTELHKINSKVAFVANTVQKLSAIFTENFAGAQNTKYAEVLLEFQKKGQGEIALLESMFITYKNNIQNLYTNSSFQTANTKEAIDANRSLLQTISTSTGELLRSLSSSTQGLDIIQSNNPEKIIKSFFNQTVGENGDLKKFYASFATAMLNVCDNCKAEYAQIKMEIYNIYETAIEKIINDMTAVDNQLLKSNQTAVYSLSISGAKKSLANFKAHIDSLK